MSVSTCCRKHDRAGWIFVAHAKNKNQGENQWRGGLRRTVVPGLVMMTPLTDNIALARARFSSVATFGGRIPAKRPSILSRLGMLESSKPKNFPLPLRMMGWNFCFGC